MSLFDSEQPAADTPAPDSAAATTATTNDAPSTEIESAASGEGLETQQPEPDDTDFEYEGAKFKVPKTVEKELKDALLRHADYTRKTQEVAAQRQEIEAARTQHQQAVQMHQALIGEVAQARAVDERLSQFQQLDWNSLIQQNPQQAQLLQAEFTRLQAQRGQLVNAITQKQQQLQLVQQQERAKLASDAQAYVQRELKDWSPEKDRALENYARGIGLDPNSTREYILRNPAFLVVLDKAARADQAERQAAQAKPKPAPPKPVSRVSGSGAGTSKTLSDMTAEEYAAARAKRKYGGK